ncbi:hypothetical protein GNI_037100 [Gregarina niphandrodes]|nr:hypothetical protein GNI_037100 [Gregarina niphandrodes]EZG78395.1 hypothetical protein GNI_037100 [Gregarina niphandrodes]|eukprot:XP_011129320.1 hypothetical protein GNI_037100 [Gregarina niphandrodes]
MLWNEMKATDGTDTDGGLRRMWCETYLANLRASEESLKMLALHIRQQEKLPRHKREERPEEYEYDLEMLYTLVGNFRDLFYGVIPVREWAKIRKQDHKQLASLENAIRPALAQRH